MPVARKFKPSQTQFSSEISLEWSEELVKAKNHWTSFLWWTTKRNMLIRELKKKLETCSQNSFTWYCAQDPSHVRSKYWKLWSMKKEDERQAKVWLSKIESKHGKGSRCPPPELISSGICLQVIHWALCRSFYFWILFKFSSCVCVHDCIYALCMHVAMHNLMYMWVNNKCINEGTLARGHVYIL